MGQCHFRANVRFSVDVPTDGEIESGFCTVSSLEYTHGDMKLEKKVAVGKVDIILCQVVLLLDVSSDSRDILCPV